MAENKIIQEKKYTANDVAEFFINLSLTNKIDDDVNEGITNLKLQKMLYFSQAAHLVLHNEELFKEDIQAWKWGPVVVSVYHKYKTFKNMPLPLPKDFVDKIGDEETIHFLNGIWEMLNKYSASELMNITHSHAPWKDAFEKGKNNVITKEALREYYKNIFQYQEEQK